MTEPAGLTPGTVESAALPRKRLGVAFGRRFFLLIGVGFVWAVPAIADPRLALAVLAWDALVLVAWAVDLAQVARVKPLLVRRSWRGPLAVGTECTVELAIENTSRVAVVAAIVDAVPGTLRPDPPHVRIAAPPWRRAAASYTVRPAARGDAQVGDAYLRCQGPLGIAERWLRADLAQGVRVYPSMTGAGEGDFLLSRSRQADRERRRARLRGAGREFESLREYREGDELRDICWTAAARRGKLVTRTYTVERSQTVWIVIDSGRLMRARVNGLSKLDHAVAGALNLARVAMHAGARVGLESYGRAVRHRLPPARGSAHLRELLARLAVVREEAQEADHLQAASRLLADQPRRCLVVWLTDIADTAMTPEVVEAASCMSPRHLVLLVAVGQPDVRDLADRLPGTEREMFQVAAASEVVHRRDLLLARLRERGILAMEANAAALSPAIVNSYLEIKARNRI